MRNRLAADTRAETDALLLRRYYPFILRCAASEIERRNLRMFVAEDIAGEFIEAKFYSGRLFNNLERGRGSFHAYLRT